MMLRAGKRIFFGVTGGRDNKKLCRPLDFHPQRLNIGGVDTVAQNLVHAQPGV